MSKHPTSTLLPFSHAKYFMGEFEIMNVGYSKFNAVISVNSSEVRLDAFVRYRLSNLL